MPQHVRNRLEEFFRSDPRGVVAVYLFGSRALGDASAGSDVDVAVLFASAPEPSLTGPALTLESDLERWLAQPVDLTVLNAAPADLVHRVLRDGQVVVDLDPPARLRFEVRKTQRVLRSGADPAPVPARPRLRRRHSDLYAMTDPDLTAAMQPPAWRHTSPRTDDGPSRNSCRNQLFFDVTAYTVLQTRSALVLPQ